MILSGFLAMMGNILNILDCVFGTKISTKLDFEDDKRKSIVDCFNLTINLSTICCFTVLAAIVLIYGSPNSIHAITSPKSFSHDNDTIYDNRTDDTQRMAFSFDFDFSNSSIGPHKTKENYTDESYCNLQFYSFNFWFVSVSLICLSLIAIVFLVNCIMNYVIE